MSYLGIDLASSPGRASAYAVLERDGSLRDVGMLWSDQEILSLARRVRPVYVAVDAPLSLPRGMCCLEISCPCTAEAADGLRAAEREVIGRGFGLFRTTKRSVIKGLVYRGMALRRCLGEAGLQVLEVYPYASKVILFGRGLPRKTTREGRAVLRAGLERLVAGLGAVGRALSHDELDALAAAYTAYLLAGGGAEWVGEEGEGVICLPRAAAGMPPTASG
jgi:predicted nuclease with RNAse H fold